MLVIIRSTICNLIDQVGQLVSADIIFETQSLLVALLLPVAVMTFEYSKGNKKPRECTWRRNALLTQCIKPRLIGLETLGVIITAILSKLCAGPSALFALLLLALQFYRLVRICQWVYDETKPAANRKYIQSCMSRYVNNMKLLNGDSLNILKSILKEGSEELDASTLVQKCLSTIKSASCSQIVAFDIANTLSESILNKNINVFEQSTLDQLAEFSVQYFRDTKMSVEAYLVLDALIDTSLNSRLNHVLFRKIWTALTENNSDQSDTFKLVRHITTRCLESVQGGPGRANSDEWNIVENIITNSIKTKDKALRYAASLGALDAYLSWLRAQISSYYSRKSANDKQAISDNIDQTTEALLGLTINQAALGDIMTLGAKFNHRPIDSATIENWSQDDRQFLMKGSAKYMDLKCIESHKDDKSPNYKWLLSEIDSVKQQLNGTTKILVASGIITMDAVDECQKASGELLSKVEQSETLAANLDRLYNELLAIKEYIKNGDNNND